MNEKLNNVANEVRGIFSSGFVTPKRNAKKILQAVYDKNGLGNARAKTTDLRLLDVPYIEERKAVLNEAGKYKTKVFIRCK